MVCDIESYLILSADKASCICAVHYYQPQNSPNCQTCHSSCITCNGSGSNNCLTCDIIPSVNTNKILVNSTCVCLEKFYQDRTNQFFCLACHYSCLTCSGPNATECTTCSTNLGRVKSSTTCSCQNGYRDDGAN